MTEARVGAATVSILQGDITEQVADGIVNAANSSLMGGGGVDGAIHRKGGPTILEECRRIRETRWRDGLPTGNAVITTGGCLKARHVIHTVGPVWHDGKHREDELLASCYRRSLEVAGEKQVRTVAFPAISTGAYGFPLERATRIAIREVRAFLEGNPALEKVVFVCFDRYTHNRYTQALNEGA